MPGDDCDDTPVRVVHVDMLALPFNEEPASFQSADDALVGEVRETIQRLITTVRRSPAASSRSISSQTSNQP